MLNQQTKVFFSPLSSLRVSPLLYLFCFSNNTMHLHIDEHILYGSAAQICTHAHTHRVQCTESSCLRLCHYCKRIPPASALTHSINLPLCDRNYAHLFSHSPHHAETLRLKLHVRLQAAGLGLMETVERSNTRYVASSAITPH